MKRVVVIGAGVGGLTSIKACLEENFEVVCYELTSYVGGLWRFRDEVEEDTVSVFRSVVLNGSKEMMAFSDFPPPQEFPTYPRQFEWYKYIEAYCDYFGLREHIKFNHKVLDVVKAKDYDTTGRWQVSVADLLNGNNVYVQHFDFVMVCSGHHVYPIMPQLLGQTNFEGRVLHSKEYKRPESFQNQKVLVIGFGNSALDIANDLCSTTHQVYLSTRRKGWIVPRVFEGGKITDNEISRRSFQLYYQFFGISWLLAKYESILNNTINHEFYGIKPKHSLGAQRPVCNDLLHINLLYGGVLLKPGIKEFKQNGVIFEGNVEVTEVDSVVFATGFQPFFPFLKGMENVDTYMDKVYKLVIPANLDHNSLAIIGMIDPNISNIVCIEMQSRWTAGVFSRKVQLPSKQAMLDEARAVQEVISKFTYEGFTQKTYTNGPPYLEDLASMLGVKPNLFQILCTDPKLFRALIFGPQVTYQFRIQGSHSWAGAREAILGAEERQTYLLRQSRDSFDNTSKKGFKHGKKLLVFILGAGLLWYGTRRTRKFFNGCIEGYVALKAMLQSVQ